MDSLDLNGADSIRIVDEQIEQFWSFFFQSLSSMQMEIKRTEETQVIVIWFSVFLPTWDNWLCDFQAEVRVRLRSCNAEVPLWEELQIRSSLSICRTSTLCSFFVGYKTLWLQFCWESFSTLPSRHGCTHVWIDLARYSCRKLKSIRILRQLYF